MPGYGPAEHSGAPAEGEIKPGETQPAPRSLLPAAPLPTARPAAGRRGRGQEWGRPCPFLLLLAAAAHAAGERLREGAAVTGH